MFDKLLFDKLACPKCNHGNLELVIFDGSELDVLSGEIICNVCQSHYPIQERVAVLFPDFLAPDLEARIRSWRAWSLKMRNFMEWRKKTWNGSDKSVEFGERASSLNQRFFDFCALPEQPVAVLDIGCGGGTLGGYVESQHLYVGVDPLLVAGETQKFRIVQGVAEKLPFKSCGFDYAAIMATLDHVKEPEVVFREAHRILSPNGYLCLMQTTQPEKSAGYALSSFLREDLSRILRGRGKDVDPEDTHIQDFSEHDLLVLINKGFYLKESRIVKTEDCVCLFAKCLKKDE